MSPPKQRTWSRDEFLELLDDRDVAALCEKWQLGQTAKISKATPEFMAAVRERSNTSLLQEVLSLRTGTLQMLRDVLVFLSDQHSALRTTGGLLVLDKEFDISPQQVDVALKWSGAALRHHSAATWENLSKRLREQVRPLLQRVTDYGLVRVARKKESLMKVALRMERGGSPRIRRIVTVTYDPEGLRSRGDYGESLEDLNRKLSVLRDLQAAADAHDFVSAIGRLGGETVPALVPVEIASAPAPASTCVPQPPSSPFAGRARSGIIEIELGGCRVRVDRDVEVEALQQVLELLRRR